MLQPHKNRSVKTEFKEVSADWRVSNSLWFAVKVIEIISFHFMRQSSHSWKCSYYVNLQIAGFTESKVHRESRIHSENVQYVHRGRESTIHTEFRLVPEWIWQELVETKPAVSRDFSLQPNSSYMICTQVCRYVGLFVVVCLFVWLFPCLFVCLFVWLSVFVVCFCLCLLVVVCFCLFLFVVWFCFFVCMFVCFLCVCFYVCMFVCVCVLVCWYVCMLVCLHADMFVCLFV